jgi:ERCC4-type nuclease
VRTPTARAAGIAKLAVVVDAHERYGYTFAGKPVVTTRQALACGDYGLMADGRLVAVVERKSLSDLVSSLLSGDLKYQMAGLAEMQISFPNVPIVFCQTLKLAEEYTYRYLARRARMVRRQRGCRNGFRATPECDRGRA